MKHFLIFLLALVSASYGQRQTVMVDTNGGVVFPTNFWEQAPLPTNVPTNVQEFIGNNNFASNSPTNSFLTLFHTVAELSATNLGIEYPHATLAVSNKLYIGRRGLTGSGNGEIVVFNDPINNFTNKTTITITNSGGIPEMAYSTNTGLIYVATVSNGIYTLNPSNNSTSLAIADPMSFVGTIAVSSDHLWWADGQVLKKYDLNNNSLVQSYTNTNVTISGGGVIAGFHAAAVTPDGTKLIVGGTSSGDSTNSPATVSVFNIASNEFTATTAIPNQTFLTDDMAVNNEQAFLGFESAGAIALAYNFQFGTFTEIGNPTDGRAFFVTRKNNDVYFGAINNTILKYNTETQKTVVFANEATNNRAYNELVFAGDVPFATTFDTVTNAIIAKLDFVPFVSSQILFATDVSGVEELPLAVTTSISNNYSLLMTNKDVYYNITPLDTNRNVLNVSQMQAADPAPFRQGQHFTIRNNSVSNNINFLTFNGIPITTIPPQQSKTWVLIDTSTTTFTNRWKQIYSREEMGLGSGITTNRVFVDLSTNTNTVTISNGIITGWTQ